MDIFNKPERSKNTVVAWLSGAVATLWGGYLALESSCRYFLFDRHGGAQTGFGETVKEWWGALKRSRNIPVDQRTGLLEGIKLEGGQLKRFIRAELNYELSELHGKGLFDKFKDIRPTQKAAAVAFATVVGVGIGTVAFKAINFLSREQPLKNGHTNSESPHKVLMANPEARSLSLGESTGQIARP